MKTKIVSIVISSFALTLGIVAICLVAPRRGELSFDYMGVIVGILSLLVTVLIGWNIATVLNFKDEWAQFNHSFEVKRKEVEALMTSHMKMIDENINRSSACGFRR